MNKSGDDEETLEYRVISVSLNSVPQKHKAGIKSVFSAFALVAEDTHVPPAIFLILLKAVMGAETLVSELQLRRWLQILINRSLVLATW